jgi:hydrogenase maturation protein HypF
VGFRPTVWRIARDLGALGDVRNDGQGVRIRVRAEAAIIEAFCRRLQTECPPLGRIDALEREALAEEIDFSDFTIVESAPSRVQTGVAPDAATCPACRAEIFDTRDRRYRYPFTNCTHCGPRLSIVRAIPYDRANTSMAGFVMCEACRQEYEDPADRRFHAQPNACPACGPRAWLHPLRDDGAAVVKGGEDSVSAAARLLAGGAIVAVKGIGGVHLACDAGNAQAVNALRERKRRYRKPFAVMTRTTAELTRYVELDSVSIRLLESPAAPIVLLPRRTDGADLAAAVAPGQTTLGCMLAYSPLHHLLLADWERLGCDRPLVMTSGNRSDEPQCIDNQDAGMRLAEVADALLLHDRDIVNRVDDSVVRVMAGEARCLRRARGYAPNPVPLPDGFADAPAILGLGGELKSTICLLRGQSAVLSPHLGDLEDALTAAEFERTIALYESIYRYSPTCLAVDLHPDYRSTRHGKSRAAAQGLRLIAVQHHHAHIASVLADNAWPLDGPPVIGIALDGLGFGPDGTVWGGECLLADYRRYERLGYLRPVPMPGGTKAILEPWRNTYAQIATAFGWEAFRERWPDLELGNWLETKPLQLVDGMIRSGLNTPRTSSCGRLFDAVAGALDVQRAAVAYEGHAAIELETLALHAALGDPGYPLEQRRENGLILDPKPMWEGLFDDLAHDRRRAQIAARFHAGLARALADWGATLAGECGANTVALSGGVFQNRTLFEALIAELRRRDLTVLSQRQVPSNDGGLSLGQAVVAAAQLAVD